MSTVSIYKLAEPTAWASPPETYSYSSLRSIRECPRRWLLVNSRWGDFKRFPQRLTPSVIEGQIVHGAIERLAKELGRAGRPTIGSPTFSAAVERCGFWEYFPNQVAVWNANLSEHPLPSLRCRLQTDPRDLANMAIRLFRQQYQAAGCQGSTVTYHAVEAGRRGGEAASLAVLLQERGRLSEVRLQHPSMPLVGVLDIVEQLNDGSIRILDFKTGSPKPAHKEQLEIYAVLWWRVTGQFPAQISVQYLDDSIDWLISPDEILRREGVLGAEIRSAADSLRVAPGPAYPGETCSLCPVRARCDEGWSRVLRPDPAPPGPSHQVDIDLIVSTAPLPTGYGAVKPNGEPVRVTYDPPTGIALERVEVGEHLRVIGAAQLGGNEIRMMPWTEVYHC